tara:strand:+ start:5318 stop:5560 length:243 start_codon:yes stop_codon:yes gene_type:complete
MKIVCTNTDYCGKTETIKDPQEPHPLATVCSSCGCLALYYSNEYEPIFKKEYTSLEIENLFIKMYLKILGKTGKTNDNNK